MILGKEPLPSGPQVPQVHNNMTLSAVRLMDGFKPSPPAPASTSNLGLRKPALSTQKLQSQGRSPNCAWFPPFPHVERQDGMGGETPGRLAARRETVEGRTECSPAPPATTSVGSCFCWQAFPQGIVHSWPTHNCRMPAVNNTHVQDGRIGELRAPSPELGVMPSLVFGVQ